MLILEQLARDLVASRQNPEAHAKALDQLEALLADMQRERQAYEETIKMARKQYASDDLEIDDEPLLSIANEGNWVGAWVWVPVEGD